ncbi:hypothetical protein HI914_07351 [Erysiphe necator]|nr:hypothetical protein HI914_07351 [Erysiphe necator]
MWVYREGSSTRKAGWQGPYRLLSVTDTRTVLKLPSGPTVFPTTHVKRCFEEDIIHEDRTRNQNSLKYNTDKYQLSEAKNTPSNSKILPFTQHKQPQSLLPTTRSSTRIRKLTEKALEFERNKNWLHSTSADLCVNFINDEERTFTASRRKELLGLLELDVFEAVPESSKPEGIRIFSSRFVDQIKMAGTPQAYPKSRLVVQAFNDSGKEQVLTQSPTLQRVSQRILLSISVSLKNHNFHAHNLFVTFI